MPEPVPRRILLTTWQDFGAGSIQSVEYLARGLLQNGHHVHVACPAEGVLGRRLATHGVPLIDFPFRKGWSRENARKLAALVEEHHIELLDAQESRDRKAAILARWLYGVRAKLVITRRQETASFPLQNLIYGWAADRVIAISEGVARSLARRGTPRSRISVVHTGLHPERVEARVSPEEVRKLRENLGLAPKLPTVGMVGRRKDQGTLLRAAALVGRPVNLVFVGIAADDALRSLETGLAAGSIVAYTGFRDAVVPFYHLLDVKVLTTRAEGLSQALLESMALGVPVIAAAAGGVPELVRDGSNGLLYPPGDASGLADALRRLLDDPALRERLVAGGRESVSGHFHADAFVARTEAVYSELLNDA